MDEKNSGSDDLSMLMSVNALQYSPPIDGSLVNSRQYKKYNFSPLNYTNGGAPEIVINSGSDYIWGPTSAIQITLETANDVTLSKAGVFGLINEFDWTHRSGDQIDRVRNVNSLVQTLINYEEGSDYAGYAKMFGVEEKTGVATPKTFILPMSLLSGAWAQKVLIPADMVAGSKLKIQLESLVRAFQGAPGATQITGVQLLLDSYDLFDAAKKALMSQSANVRTQGLQFSYHSWAQTNKTFTAGTYDLDINLSAAKTILLLAKTRTTAALADQAADSIQSEPYAYKSWRVRLGSNTNPQHEVTNTAEAYFLTQNAFGNKHNQDLHSSHRVSSGTTYADYTGDFGKAVVCISLEKNAVTSLSGEATNNSRLLNISGEFEAAANRQMDVWVKHLRIANVMRDNVVIDK